MKSRLDLWLVRHGLVETRARAQALIEAGLVVLEGRALTRASLLVEENAQVALAGTLDYVSRGSLKLEAALDAFNLSPHGAVCLDIGASTGGFTQTLLKRGARRVYAVDAGQGQLAPVLRNDPRVLSLEKTNARHLNATAIPQRVDWIVIDVSFISLTLALPPALALAAETAWLVALIKPQFEAGREGLGKGGIVRDPALHRQICQRIETWLGGFSGWHVLGIQESPITGGDGNREFLLAAQRMTCQET
jgi:23S rRNA (cytidine1920-2'-O)/16S rRNA (cytidine1409-2'-O)-methyltransferase